MPIPYFHSQGAQILWQGVRPVGSSSRERNNPTTGGFYLATLESGDIAIREWSARAKTWCGAGTVVAWAEMPPCYRHPSEERLMTNLHLRARAEEAIEKMRNR